MIRTCTLLLLGMFTLTGCAVMNPAREHSIMKMTRIFHPTERVENHRGMDRVFPSNPIAPSSQPVVWPGAAQPLPATFAFNNRVASLSDYIQKTATTSLLVIRDGRIVSEQYFLGASATSQFTSWSVAKSFVATLVGIALAEGKIASLDDTVAKYLPHLSDDAVGAASVRSLLHMASGVKFDETYTDRWSDINFYYYNVFIFGRSADRASIGFTREAAPGARFRYSSVDTQVLTQILRAVYATSLAQLVQTKLWQPLGMESPAYWSADARGGTEIGFCCLNATARDYAKLGQLYLQNGVWNGTRLLSADWVRMATRPAQATHEPGAANPFNVAGSNGIRGYAMHFWVPEKYDGEYFANGVWGQSIWVDEKTKTVIVRTAVDPQYREHLAETFAVMRSLSGR